MNSTRFYIDNAIQDRLGFLLSNEPHKQCLHVKRVLVPVLAGNDSRDITDAWIKCFGRWAAQESLSDDLALLYAAEYMEQTDYAWALQFSVGHNWEDFVRKYFQRTLSSDLETSPESDSEHEVERFMGWYRSEQGACRKRNATDAIRFSRRELDKVTEHYSVQNIIGEGNFGTVFRGHLATHSLEPRPVAVKRLRLVTPEVLSVINKEVSAIAGAQCKHPHLLKLVGWSLSLKDPVLVYEYVPNGNLREHLDGLRGLKLSWGTRMKIAIETALALTHLHSSLNMIHGDVKATNILLDEYFSAKVADFGISKTSPVDCSCLNSILVGSPGYLDPHFLQNYELDDKSDVYSFGVILLELVSGLTVVDSHRPRNKLTLAALAISRVKNHRLGDLFEPYLVQTGAPLDLRQWKKVALLALQCVRVDPDARPSMKEALDTLKELRPMFSKSYRAPGTACAATLLLPSSRSSRKSKHHAQFAPGPWPAAADESSSSSGSLKSMACAIHQHDCRIPTETRTPSDRESACPGDEERQRSAAT